jgi:hypothetical protein
MARQRLPVGIHDASDPALLVPAERDVVTGRVARGPRRGDKDRPDSRDAASPGARRVWPVALGVVGAVVVASSAAALATRDPETAPTSPTPVAASPSGTPTTIPAGAVPTASAGPPSTPPNDVREYRVVSFRMTSGAVTGTSAQTTTVWDRGPVSMSCSEGRCSPVCLPQFVQPPASVPSSDGTHAFKVVVQVLENQGCTTVTHVASGTVTFAGTSMRTNGSIPPTTATCGDGRIEYGGTTWSLVGELVP